MAEKFRNKYRIPSARLVGWDYRDDAMYFITICCKDRRHFFGEIEKGKMILTETGQLCEKYLLGIPEHFPFVSLDAGVVMPDHVHAIVVIGRGDEIDDGDCRTVACNGSTIPTNKFMASISPKPGSLSTIIRSFKSAVTKDARAINPDFNWQTRFHDHVIRDEGSHQRIKKIHRKQSSKLESALIPDLTFHYPTTKVQRLTMSGEFDLFGQDQPPVSNKLF